MKTLKLLSQLDLREDDAVICLIRHAHAKRHTMALQAAQKTS